MTKKTVQQKVYEAVKMVPRGKVTTYGEISRFLCLRSSRLVGKILSQNNDCKTIPCYRVVKSNGDVGGYNQGVKEKIKRLESDGIIVKNFKIKDLNTKLFKFFCKPNQKGRSG